MDVTSSFSICTHSPFPTFLYLEKESVLDISHPIHRSIEIDLWLLLLAAVFLPFIPHSIPIFVHGVNVRTTVANSVAAADSAIKELRSILRSKPKKVVGLDCNCRPNEPGQLPNKVTTLQLCTEDFIVILQLLYVDSMPDSLRSFLDDPQVTFVGSKMREHVKVSWDCRAQRNRHWSVGY